MNKFTIEQTMTVLTAMSIPLDAKLAIHMGANFDAKIPKSMFPVLKQAILLDSYGFDWDETQLDLPNEYSFQGAFKATLRDVIERHHLVWFLKDTEDNQRSMSVGGFTIETVDVESENAHEPTEK
jgi:hypothetical protein